MGKVTIDITNHDKIWINANGEQVGPPNSHNARVVEHPTTKKNRQRGADEKTKKA